MKSNVDLYLNVDKTRVVAASDPDARFLLVRAGKNMPDGEISQIGAGLLSQARELGRGEEQEAESEPEPKQEEPAEEKQVDAPAEDKAVKAPAETKSRGHAAPKE